MAIQQFDLGRSVADGAATAGAINQVQQTNRLRDLFETQGAGIMSGDANALRALAEIDPAQALELQRSHAAERRAQAQFGYAQNRENRAAETHKYAVADRQAQIAEEAAANAARQTAEENARDLASASNLVGWMGGAPSEATYNRVVGFLAQEDPAAAQALGPFSEESWGQVKDILEGTYRGLLQATGAADPRLEQSEPDQRSRKIADSMRLYGWDEATATAHVDGYIKVVPDQLGGYNIVDVRNPKGAAQAASEPDQSTPQLRFAPVPGVSDSFGIEGGLKSGANFLTDIVGADVPFPEVQEGRATLGVLREGILGDMAAAWDRQPPSWVLRAMDENIPNVKGVKGVTQGPSDAQAKLKALSSEFSSQLRTMKVQLNRPMKPTDRADLERKIIATEAALARIENVRASFDNGNAGDLPQSFISDVGDLPEGLTPQDIWNELDAETRKSYQQ